MEKQNPENSIVRSAKESGRATRFRRKNRNLTLETVCGLGNPNPRLLSEIERSKETVGIGKVLKVLRVFGLEVAIKPRGATLTHFRIPGKQKKNR